MTKLDHAKSELTAKFGMTETVFHFFVLDALELAYATTRRWAAITGRGAAAHQAVLHHAVPRADLHRGQRSSTPLVVAV